MFPRMNYERLRPRDFAKSMAKGWLLWAALTFVIGLIAWGFVSAFGAMGLAGELIDLVSCVAALCAVIWIGTKIFR